MKKAVLTLITLLAIAADGNACSTRADSTESFAHEIIVKPLKEISRGISLEYLDVLKVLVPATSPEQWTVVINPEGSGTLRRLTTSEFQHISTHRRTGADQAKDAPGFLPLYFGALLPGKVTVFLTNTKAAQPNTTAVEFTVRPRKTSALVKTHTVIRLTESDQHETPKLIRGDRLELILPGSAFADWDINGQEAGVTLRRRTTPKPGYVRLLFDVETSGSGKLVVKQNAAGAREYRFEFSRDISMSLGC